MGLMVISIWYFPSSLHSTLSRAGLAQVFRSLRQGAQCREGRRRADMIQINAVALLAPMISAWHFIRGSFGSFPSDLAPKFYPILSSPLPLDLPCWAMEATGAGAEPSA